MVKRPGCLLPFLPSAFCLLPTAFCLLPSAFCSLEPHVLNGRAADAVITRIAAVVHVRVKLY